MLDVNTSLLLILGGVTVAVLLQAFVLLGIFLTMRKAVQTAKQQAEEYRSKITPLIETGSQLITTGKDLVASTQTLIDGLKPQLQTAVTEMADMTRDIHGQMTELQATVDEVRQKARHQVNRVDNMTTSVLNGLDRFGSFLNDAVHVPIRQVNGFVAAAKAVVDTLRSPAPVRPRPRPAPQPASADEGTDMFV